MHCSKNSVSKMTYTVLGGALNSAHSLFQEHRMATVTEVLLQLDRVCGSASYLAREILTAVTSNAN